MKKLLCVLTSLVVGAGLFTGCEKPNENGEGGGGTVTEQLASIQGKVTDKENGNPISGVTIELQSIGKQVQTAEDGDYRFDSLSSGNYTIKATKEGYKDFLRENIQLIAGQSMALDMELEEAEAPIIPEDYTETAFGMKLEMVYVEGGTFEMGATPEQGNTAMSRELPVRDITLNSYYIGKYEITQEQWKAVMGAADTSEFKGDDRPKDLISYERAQAFCKKLSEETGRQYVLPTEAQWEYAARGGNASQHYKYSGSNNLDEVAWYFDNCDEETHPVGTKKANELGIYDMSGNVWEWCSDWYVSPYDADDTDNPQGPETGTKRVIRGGSWYTTDFYCRVAFRNFSTPDFSSYNTGFRIVCISK